MIDSFFLPPKKENLWGKAEGHTAVEASDCPDNAPIPQSHSVAVFNAELGVG